MHSVNSQLRYTTIHKIKLKICLELIMNDTYAYISFQVILNSRSDTHSSLQRHRVEKKSRIHSPERYNLVSIYLLIFHINHELTKHNFFFFFNRRYKLTNSCNRAQKLPSSPINQHKYVYNITTIQSRIIEINGKFYYANSNVLHYYSIRYAPHYIGTYLKKTMRC